MERRLLEVDGLTVATAYHPAPGGGLDQPLLVALHGGTYSSAYFEVAGGPLGSFLEVAGRNGFSVLTIDRPGYGESTLLPEEENTFARQAAILDEAIGQATAIWPTSGVVLVGHSIGGMIGLEIAARHPDWPLLGVATSGNGARIPSGGAAEALGSLPFTGVVDLPVPDRDGVMFGPAGTFSEAALIAAHGSYAPTPFVELVRAPVWAVERLDEVAGAIQVPVHNVLGEYDALWDSSPEALSDYQSRFAGPVSVSVMRGSGHSIDHHLVGATLQLQQLAFAHACAATHEATAVVA